MDFIKKIFIPLFTAGVGFVQIGRVNGVPVVNSDTVENLQRESYNVASILSPSNTVDSNGFYTQSSTTQFPSVTPPPSIANAEHLLEKKAITIGPPGARTIYDEYGRTTIEYPQETRVMDENGQTIRVVNPIRSQDIFPGPTPTTVEYDKYADHTVTLINGQQVTSVPDSLIPTDPTAVPTVSQTTIAASTIKNIPTTFATSTIKQPSNTASATSTSSDAPEPNFSDSPKSDAPTNASKSPFEPRLAFGSMESVAIQSLGEIIASSDNLPIGGMVQRKVVAAVFKAVAHYVHISKIMGKMETGPGFVEWTAAAAVFGELAIAGELIPATVGTAGLVAIVGSVHQAIHQGDKKVLGNIPPALLTNAATALLLLYGAKLIWTSQKLKLSANPEKAAQIHKDLQPGLLSIWKQIPPKIRSRLGYGETFNFNTIVELESEAAAAVIKLRQRLWNSSSLNNKQDSDHGQQNAAHDEQDYDQEKDKRKEIVGKKLLQIIKGFRTGIGEALDVQKDTPQVLEAFIQVSNHKSDQIKMARWMHVLTNLSKVIRSLEAISSYKNTENDLVGEVLGDHPKTGDFLSLTNNPGFQAVVGRMNEIISAAHQVMKEPINEQPVTLEDLKLSSQWAGQVDPDALKVGLGWKLTQNLQHLDGQLLALEIDVKQILGMEVHTLATEADVRKAPPASTAYQSTARKLPETPDTDDQEAKRGIRDTAGLEPDEDRNLRDAPWGGPNIDNWDLSNVFKHDSDLDSPQRSEQLSSDDEDSQDLDQKARNGINLKQNKKTSSAYRDEVEAESSSVSVDDANQPNSSGYSREGMANGKSRMPMVPSSSLTTRKSSVPSPQSRRDISTARFPVNVAVTRKNSDREEILEGTYKVERLTNVKGADKQELVLETQSSEGIPHREVVDISSEALAKALKETFEEALKRGLARNEHDGALTISTNDYVTINVKQGDHGEEIISIGSVFKPIKVIDITVERKPTPFQRKLMPGMYVAEAVGSRDHGGKDLILQKIDPKTGKKNGPKEGILISSDARGSEEIKKDQYLELHELGEEVFIKIYKLRVKTRGRRGNGSFVEESPTPNVAKNGRQKASQPPSQRNGMHSGAESPRPETPEDNGGRGSTDGSPNVSPWAPNTPAPAKIRGRGHK